MLRHPARLVLGLILVVTLVIGSLQLAKWRTFEYNGLDLAIYTNTVHNLAFGHGFASSIHDPSYLGDHLELGLLPVAALYRVAPSGLTLLWIQTLLITGTAWLVWLVLRHVGGWKVGLVGATLWLLHPFVWNVSLYEFHGIAFAWPVLWWSILAYQRHQRTRWWFALGVLCLLREDLPLLVLGWAVLAAVDRRGWRWWAPATLGGLAWFVIAQQIISAANPLETYKYLAFFRWAGDTPGEILTIPFRQPLVFLAHIFQPNNWVTTIGLLLATGGLAVGRPRLLIPTGLAYAQLLMLGAQPESILRLHYVVPFLPFLIWAATETWLAIRAREYFRRADPMIVMALTTALIIVGPLYAHLLYGPIELPWKPRIDSGASPTAVLQAAAAEVRPDDRVLTTFNFLPNLASRPTVYSLNYLYLGRRQYTEERYTIPTDIDVAVIDWQQLYQYQFLYRTTEYEGRTGAERIRDFLEDQGLTLAWWRDSVAVYRRGGTDDFIPTTRISVRDGAGQIYGPLTILRKPVVNPIVTQTIGRHVFSTVPVEFEWLRTKDNELPLSIRFTASQNNHIVWSSTRLIGQGVYPTVDWPVGSGWVTRYFLSLPEYLGGTIALKAEALELDGRYRLNRLRTFSPVIETTTSLGQIDLGEVTLPMDNP